MSNFYEYKDTFPFLESLKENITLIKKEYEQIKQEWQIWPEKHLYLGHTDWTVYPFYGFNQWVPKACQECPETTKMLKNIKGLRSALFSRLGPKTVLKKHQGWASLANYVLRCHLGVDVPERNGQISCGIWVNGEKREQIQDEWLVFDDSKLHSGYNMTDKERVVLLLDIERPIHVPKGVSEIEDTLEMLNLAKYFQVNNN